MERKIGETFEYEGKTLRVKETTHYLCTGCFFDGRCLSVDKVGNCQVQSRTDKKNVIFLEITDEQPQEQAEQPKLNLCEILKDCPQGETFWSPMLGYVNLCYIDIEAKHVTVTIKIGATWDINANGTITIDDVTSEEIMLYPSREQRDWNKFTAPWLKKEKLVKPKFKVGDRIRHKETNKDDVYEISKVYDDSYGIAGFTWVLYMKYQDQYELVLNKFDPKTLKPFDRVITKNDYDVWTCTLFSHISNKPDTRFMYATCESVYKYCIPYNDETKHLVGTKEEAPDFYKYWED